MALLSPRAPPRLLLLVLGLTLAVATLGSAPEASEASSSLDVDDECGVGGESPGCALSALQLRAGGARQQEVSRHEAEATNDEESELGCHNAQKGEKCYDVDIMWAKNEGMVSHPDWYKGLTPESSTIDIQQFIYSSGSTSCPRPCIARPTPWCLEGAVAPRLWTPPTTGATQQIKILTYNLFWWNLFKIRGGNGNSAGNLIKDNMAQEFDVMGFQECEDPERVLQPVGLLDTYQVFLGKHAICMAYNKKAWSLIVNGTEDVAEDMPTKYYGKRGVQWMRLKSKATDKTLFFMNHHGPLSVNSGGTCGGEATAFNLMRVMAKYAQVGDVLVLVGDFNANAASLTVQTLWTHMVQAFAGTSWGGVDNIFTNVPTKNIVERKIMGSGGSDHDAIYAVLEVGKTADVANHTMQPPQSAEELTGAARPGYKWQAFWCGRLEDNTAYSFSTDAWSHKVTGQDAADPEHCCRVCQANQQCQSWLWKDFAVEASGKQCIMSGAHPVSKKSVDGFVSGLTYTAAAATAAESAKHAVSQV